MLPFQSACMDPVRRHLAFVGLILSFCLIYFPAVQAQVRNWASPSSGSYGTASNWSPADTPDTNSETAQFNQAAAYSVFIPGVLLPVGNVNVLAGDVAFSPLSATDTNLFVNDKLTVDGGNLTLNQTGGGGDMRVNVPNVEVEGGSDFVLDEGALTTVTSSLLVGDFISDTNGRLIIQNGSSLALDASASVNVGVDQSGGSEITITGLGSSFTGAVGSGTISIGANSSASLRVLDSAAANLAGRQLEVATTAAATGSLLVVDGASTLQMSDTLNNDIGTTFIGGSSAAGDVQVTAGGQAELGQAILRGGSSVRVDGAASSLSVLGLDVEDQSQITIENGGLLNFATSLVRVEQGSSLTMRDSGTLGLHAGSISLEGDSDVLRSRMEITAGAQLLRNPAIPGTSFEVVLDDFSAATISGANSLVDNSDLFFILQGTSSDSSPELNVSDSGELRTFSLRSVRGIVTLDGGTVRTQGNVDLAVDFVGQSSGEAELTLLSGGVLDVGDKLRMGNDASLNLFGGDLRIGDLSSLQYTNQSNFQWNSGTVTATGSTSLAPASATLLVPNGQLTSGKKLQVLGELTLQSSLSLTGGTLSVEGLTNPELFQLQSGRLEWQLGSFNVSPTGPLGEFIDLPSDATIFVADDFFVFGTLTGEGTIEGPSDVFAGGKVIVESGERLTFSNSLSNSGEIQLQGGRLDIGSQLNIATSGRVVGRGTLAAATQTVVQGDLLLTNGQTDIFGNVSSLTTGRVIVSGNADVTFWGNVTHAGAAFHVASGSSVTFFDNAGFSITGGGDVFFEGNVMPGSSPGVETFGGNVHFGALSSVEIEIAGIAAGTEYDRIETMGNASLEGELFVELLDGFAPDLGDVFEVVAADSVSGTFANTVFPSFDPLLKLEVVYQFDSVALAVVPVVAGDYNADGVVDSADYTVWRDSLGQLGTGLAADGDLSGEVDSADFLVWSSNFGNSASVAFEQSTVPEPTTCCAAMLCLGIAAVCRRRMRAG